MRSIEMPRYEIFVYDPEEKKYVLYANITANSSAEARKHYEEQRVKYKKEPRHKMVRPPIVYVTFKVRRKLPWPKSRGRKK